MLIIPQDNLNYLVPKSSGQTLLTSSFYWIIMYFLNLVDSSLWQFLYPICQLLENKKTNYKTHRKFALCQCLWKRRTMTNKKRDQASNLPYNMLLYFRRRWHYEVTPVLMNYPEPWQPCTITCSAVGTTDKQQTMSNWDLAQELIMIYLWHLWGNSIPQPNPLTEKSRVSPFFTMPQRGYTVLRYYSAKLTVSQTQTFPPQFYRYSSFKNSNRSLKAVQ